MFLPSRTEIFFSGNPQQGFLFRKSSFLFKDISDINLKPPSCSITLTLPPLDKLQNTT